MSRLGKLLRDVSGLARILGFSFAVRWLAAIARCGRSILRTRNLQGADRLMGTGPFDVRYRNSVQFRIRGVGAFSGIREMYVRDTYLHGGVLEIEPGDRVLDLGANMGNFTSLALAHGASRVIAVEPSSELNAEMWSSLALNPGFAERVCLCRVFLGAPSGRHLPLSDDPAYQGVPWVSEEQLISDAGIDAVDFLKCDIEGGEYELLKPGSRLLSMARKLAIEIHAFAGDVERFIGMLRTQGFSILYIQRDPDGTATVLARRN